MSTTLVLVPTISTGTVPHARAHCGAPFNFCTLISVVLHLKKIKLNPYVNEKLLYFLYIV